MILSTVRKGNEQEYNLKVQKIENERQLALDAASLQVMTEEEKQREVWAINQKYDQMKQELKKQRGLNHIFQQRDFMGYTRAIMAMEDEIVYLLTQQLTSQA